MLTSAKYAALKSRANTTANNVWREASIVIAPSVSTDPLVPTEETLDWSSPTTLATPKGVLAPAVASANLRSGGSTTGLLVGLQDLSGLWVWSGEVAPLTPETTRLTVGARSFRVLRVAAWESHTEALLEEL